MSRVEENDRVIRSYEMTLSGVTYEKAMLRLTGAISATLFDISKSLAVIADNMKGGAE